MSLDTNMYAHPQFPPEIGDNDLYTGREVKRLLQQAREQADSSPYVKTGVAADISGINRNTLKSAAPRYYQQQQNGDRPLIRVRRTSTAKGAHWLFHEGDCWAVAAQRPSCPDQASTSTHAECEDDPTVAFWSARTTASI